jgi:NAD(P)-dependent dehydrogenase (short-subunit alcohol dehydrogenase family)
VERFLREETRVFAGARKESQGLAKLAVEFPERLHVVPLDVANGASVRAAVAHITRLTPAIDVLVNNAAVQLDHAIALAKVNLDDGTPETTFTVNVLGPLRMTQQFLPLLEQGQRKLIINISSEAGSIGDCWRDSEFAYCMSKAALNMQTRLLANHLKPHGIQVISVQPGWMRTDMGGAGAPLDPQQSAADIVHLARTFVDSGVFINHTAHRLAW